MDRTDDALTGALTGVTDEVWTVGILLGFCAGNLPHFSPHDFWGSLTGFQLTVTM